MEFAKNVSTRIIYMDEGGIYEEGSPQIIFNSPKREKTRAFINRVKSFRYETDSKDFDFIELTNNLLNFCNANALSKANLNKAGLLSEELTVNLIPKEDLRSINFGFPDNQESFELSVTYGGEKRDVMQVEDFSVDIIKGIADSIIYKCESDTNELYFKWAQ